MAEQIRNDDMIELLRADFFARYEPNAAWVHAGAHMQLAQLRGYWPFSSVDNSGHVYDLSGQARTLTNHNTTPFGVYNLFPYANLTPGGTNYFSHIDAAYFDITGDLTLGLWCYLDTLAPGNNMGLISKWTTAGNQESYHLYFDDASNTFKFAITTDGSTDVIVTSTATVAASTWYHVVGRFLASKELSIFVDGVETLNAVGIPATIFSGSASLLFGSYDAGGMLLDGRITQGFICADDLDDVIITSLYHQTRANFGK